MNYIPNTDVYYHRKGEYDLYRYANGWYLVDNGAWYRANTWQGPYATIDLNDVPEEVTSIPENYRSHWVATGAATGSVDEDRDAPAGSHTWAGSLPRKPSMHKITETGVLYSGKAGVAGLYRYQTMWYLIEDGAWYRSASWRGPFVSVSVSYVPREVLLVPKAYRKNWVVPARD
jgi:hypothetical protein